MCTHNIRVGLNGENDKISFNYHQIPRLIFLYDKTMAKKSLEENNIRDVYIYKIVLNKMCHHMSLVMRKSDICICENKDADQLICVFVFAYICKYPRS